jgi:hypothetical protein
MEGGRAGRLCGADFRGRAVMAGRSSLGRAGRPPVRGANVRSPPRLVRGSQRLLEPMMLRFESESDYVWGASRCTTSAAAAERHRHDLLRRRGHQGRFRRHGL